MNLSGDAIQGLGFLIVVAGLIYKGAKIESDLRNEINVNKAALKSAKEIYDTDRKYCEAQFATALKDLHQRQRLTNVKVSEIRAYLQKTTNFVARDDEDSQGERYIS